jgi:hypothetical protein
VLAAIAADLGTFTVVELDAIVAAEAKRLLARYVLCAGDAVQLASCLTLAKETDRGVELVAFDARLRAAARAEDLVALPRRVRHGRD